MLEALARTLRHEFGDFLQKVYATVAILQDRAPDDWEVERDILARLRHRAEECKDLLDGLQDFLCPLTLERQPTDLAQLAGVLVAQAREKHPRLHIATDARSAVIVAVDPKRIAQVGKCLLINACEASAGRINFKTTMTNSGAVEWRVTDDGPGVPPERLNKIFDPFFTTRAGHAGLGLALAQKIAQLHGGGIFAENVPAGGFSATVSLPQYASGERGQ